MKSLLLVLVILTTPTSTAGDQAQWFECSAAPEGKTKTKRVCDYTAGEAMVPAVVLCKKADGTYKDGCYASCEATHEACVK